MALAFRRLITNGSREGRSLWSRTKEASNLLRDVPDLLVGTFTQLHRPNRQLEPHPLTKPRQNKYQLFEDLPNLKPVPPSGGTGLADPLRINGQPMGLERP